MKTSLYIIALTSFLIMSGCSSRKNVHITPNPAVTDATVISGQQPDPELLGFKKIAVKDTMATLPESVVVYDKREIESSTESMPPFDIKFVESETQHVRLRWMSPPIGQMLTLDLSALSSSFCYPGTRHVISNYGMRGSSLHTGVDIKASAGDTLRAAMAGVVRMSKLYGDYGNVIVIRHACGIETVYSHNSRNLVKPNDKVDAGQAVAIAGKTGRATTEHLHFEVRAAGIPFDPSLMIDHQNRSLRNDTIYILNKGTELLVMNSKQAADFRDGKISSITTSYNREPLSIGPQIDSETPMAHNVSGKGDDMAVYVVQKGDMLSVLAQTFRISLDSLCRLNSLDKTSIIIVGQKLIVSGEGVNIAAQQKDRPVEEVSKPVSTPAAKEILPTTQEKTIPEFHTLATGETLSGIAHRYKIDMEELCRINNITNPNLIKVGERLRLKQGD